MKTYKQFCYEYEIGKRSVDVEQISDGNVFYSVSNTPVHIPTIDYRVAYF